MISASEVNIKELVSKWKDKPGNLIMVLHELQNECGYVPRDLAFQLSALLDVPMARIYEVITFYNYFKLEKPGMSMISVCLGTACYLKGGPVILDEFKKILHIEEGQTTKDGLFHLQVVRCLGCCGLSPVVMVDEKVHAKVNKKDVLDIISEHTKAK